MVTYLDSSSDTDYIVNFSKKFMMHEFIRLVLLMNSRLEKEDLKTKDSQTEKGAKEETQNTRSKRVKKHIRIQDKIEGLVYNGRFEIYFPSQVMPTLCLREENNDDNYFKAIYDGVREISEPELETFQKSIRSEHNVGDKKGFLPSKSLREITPG